MSTEYTVELDREACAGVFACLVRDDRFVEASDGLASIARSEGEPTVRSEGATTVATFTDDRLDDARQAARACPLDAIDVGVTDE
jgi:ferredoxin